MVIEDIIDSGRTMIALLEALNNLKAKSVCSAIAFDKYNAKRMTNYVAEYTGFDLQVSEDLFIVGYGTDYNEWFREIPHLFVLNESGYKEKENTKNQVVFKGKADVAQVDEWLKTNVQSIHAERTKAFMKNNNEEGLAFYTSDAVCLVGQKLYSGE